MHSPWRRSSLAVTARVAVLLTLLVALYLPAQQMVHRGIHTAVLIHQPAGETSSATRDRLVSDLGQSTTLTINSPVADLNEAIQNALWEIDPAMQGAIVVVSEGQWNSDVLATLRQARAARTPVFWLPLIPVDTGPKILQVLAPDRARGGQQIAVSLEIRTVGSVEVVLLANNLPVARRNALQPGAINFQIELPDTGPLYLGAEMRDSSSGDVIARIEQGAVVNIETPPSILVVSAHPSLFAESLRIGGWSVTELSPRELGGRVDNLRQFACLVLDDVAVSDLPTTAWSAISSAVRRDAMGLLVLGGPHSFGLGAYRGSQLESLLPVISEPPEDESPASLVFLIDVSGSMDRADATNRRLQIARQAVLETVTALRSSDRIGLMTFDVEAKELLSLDSRADHAKSIEQAWPQRASGGTRLIPSLRHAIDLLQRDDSKQKMLVLLTDGFLASDDVDQLDDTLRDSDIELIAMIVDDGSRSDIGQLSRIANANRGRVIRVDDVLRLPALMRSEIESRRPALMTGPNQPKVTSPASWLPGDVAWPIVDAYLLTRPRDEARIHLVSERGDVLVASIHAGAGRVVAITSGLSDWATNWLRWKHWPNIAAGLTNFVAAQSTSNIDINLQQSTTVMTELSIELAERILPDESLHATLVSPSGRLNSIDLQPRSPGQLGTDLQLESFGQYSLTVDSGSITTRHRFLNHPKNFSFLNDPPLAKTWLDDGLLKLWQPDSLSKLQNKIDWRSWLVGLALLSFLLLLALERLNLDWKNSRWFDHLKNQWPT